MDVKSCFDTIPHTKLLEVLRMIISQHRYKVERHAEIRPPNRNEYRKNYMQLKKPAIKYKCTSHVIEEESTNGCENPVCKTGTITVDKSMDKDQRRQDLIDLLEEHVRCNIVKFGKCYYRQISGISQGSIISTLLCSFFYGDMERKHLNFLRNSQSLLLRLIDDFLLITTDKSQAINFVQTMHKGIPEYGICVKADKTRVNFECELSGRALQRIDNLFFNYCGTLINTRNLELKKHAERRTSGTNGCMNISTKY